MSLRFRNGAKQTSHIGQLIGIDLCCSFFSVVIWGSSVPGLVLRDVDNIEILNDQ